MLESLVFSHAKILFAPCFLTFYSTEVDPYSLFKFIFFYLYVSALKLLRISIMQPNQCNIIELITKQHTQCIQHMNISLKLKFKNISFTLSRL